MSDTLSSTVGTWALKPCEAHPAESVFVVGHSPEGNETALVDDSRQLVDAKDIQPGGKYYSVVKLQIRYEMQDATDQRWAQGSGWLVKPDLLVTAGHCAFDHTYNLGRAVEVKAYVGYAGKESVNTKNVQFRHGARILTTSGWLSNDVNRQNDVSFIVLDSPFQNVTPFKWQSTPTHTTKMLGVVGYPADKTYKDEPAARMYSQFKKVTLDLDSTFLNMIEYTISSYGGQSGSPVIVQDENTSIGTHVYGLGEKNAASAIRGQYGNFYHSYIDALAGTIAEPQPGDPWTTLSLPATEDAFADAPRSEAEDFWDTLKKVAHVGASVGSSVLGVATPFLGPVGGPIAALAGGAMGIIGQVTESSMAAESSMEKKPAIVPTNHKPHMCRAILSEAALQTVLKMDATTASNYGVFEHMQKCFHEHKQSVPALAQTLQPVLMEPALRIALDSTLPKASQVEFPVVPPPEGTEAALDSNADSFANAIQDAAHSHGETEGFLDFLGPIIKTGVKVLPIAVDAIGSIINAVKTESAMSPPADNLQSHMETLCHRALLGDAALQALMTIPPQKMKEEGFLSGLVSVVKNVGATVIKAAPGVIRVVGPVVTQLIQQNLNGNANGESAGLGPAIKPKKSINDLLNDDSVTEPPLPTGSPAHLSNGTYTKPVPKIAVNNTSFNKAPMLARPMVH